MESGTLRTGTRGERPVTTSPLDNPVLSSLEGPQRRFAQRHGSAWRYDPEVSVFAAIPDEPDESSWRDLRALAGDEMVILFRDEVRTPNDWADVFAGVARQYTGDDVPGQLFDRALRLAARDVPEMLDLVARTEPGPFRARTIELGHYVGVRDEGRLVAMAGQRFHPDGHREISAVCSDPNYRGQGLASALVRHLIATTTAEGERSFLHVASTNTSAISLYESLGFNFRRNIAVVGLQPKSP